MSRVRGIALSHVLRHPSRRAVLQLGILLTGSLAAAAPVSVYGPDSVSAASPGILLQVGHQGSVAVLAASSDGRRLVTAGVDGAVKIWDSNSGLLVAQADSEPLPVTSLAVSQDGRLLAAGLETGGIRLFDMATGAAAGSLLASYAQSPVRSLSFCGGGHALLAGCGDGSVRMTASDCGTFDRGWSAAGMSVTGVAVSPDSRLYACGLGAAVDDSRRATCRSVDRIELRQVVDDRLAMTYLFPQGLCGQFTFSPDGRRIAVCCRDGSTALVDLATGAVAARLIREGSYPCSAQYSPDGARILTRDPAGAVMVWDASTGRASRSPGQVLGGGGCAGAVWLDRGRAIATGLSSGDILFWRTSNAMLVRAIDADVRPRISSAGFSRDGRYLAVGMNWAGNAPGAGVLLLGCDETRKTCWLPRTRAVRSVAFSPSADLVAAISGNGVVAWNYANWRSAVGLAPDSTSASMALAARLQFVDRGRILVAATRSGQVQRRTAAAGALDGPAIQAPGSLASFAASPDGRRVATFSVRNEGRKRIGALRLYDSRGPAGGTCLGLYALKAPPEACDVALAPSPDGRFFVVGSEIRSFVTGRVIARLPEGAGAAAFSRDSRSLFTDRGDIWDMWRKIPRGRLCMPGDARVLCLAASGDGRRVVGGCDDGEVRVWDASTGALLGAVRLLPCTADPAAPPDWIAQAPDGRYVCSCGAGRYVAFRNIDGGPAQPDYSAQLFSGALWTELFGAGAANAAKETRYLHRSGL